MPEKSNKTIWDYLPRYGNWECHKCHWLLEAELYGCHPYSKGYRYCPYCGTPIEGAPVEGILYKGDKGNE